LTSTHAAVGAGASASGTGVGATGGGLLSMSIKAVRSISYNNPILIFQQIYFTHRLVPAF